jgi:hypothetical protein
MTKYEILKAIHEESNEGWIWIQKEEEIKSRNFIKIEWSENKPKGGKSIRCQARTIDKNFYKFYTKRKETVDKIESNSIIINEYFREKLGITDAMLKQRNVYNLSILKSNCCIQKILAFLQHPNDVVKIATWLVIFSILLSLISIMIAIFT